MRYILDNPAWNALNTGNRHFAVGAEKAKHFMKTVSRYAGMLTNSANNLDQLYESHNPGETIAVFSTSPLSAKNPFKEVNRIRVVQMLFEAPVPAPVEDVNLIKLTDEHIPAMLELTRLTQPGPFLSRTIDFGNYYGIFEGETLIAMAGQRLKPYPYTEISAVCCHPEHIGKGYASRLIKHQARLIREARSFAFLHVAKGNTKAIALYDKLGFNKRRDLDITILGKE
ncbi:GNAT family N-acetyltransferase [Mucilaginibacter jinjuensis]|uniref:GNAT family N-acetyltransferase n=1 Tax=Mucilaginibacter jinjuensis TaxID=1176721 RepID=A0ABY7TEY2_9SPHI|nr:GNAT family N-acetyltransferase [Mucilaginibacter jinjuensis]WCT14288.1 GNAT family N-acetyltransferase [Mucilaginibacter jinjuensis]